VCITRGPGLCATAPRQRSNGKWDAMAKHHPSQGTIVGKRSGLSNSVGPNARKRALKAAHTATGADDPRMMCAECV